MTKFVDILKRNVEGYPRTVYDDGETKLEVWKFNKISMLTLLIANHLISEQERGAIVLTINDVEHISLDLPNGMNPRLRRALDGERFQREDEPDDVVRTDQFLIILLGVTLTNDIGKLFDANNVRYEKDQYIEFKKQWSSEWNDFHAELNELDRLHAAAVTKNPKAHRQH